jgi:hypothetical protein
VRPQACWEGQALFGNYTSKPFISSQGTFNPQQISASAGIGRHYQSGLGIEGEIQRTLQSDLKRNPCVTVSSGSQTGNCAGSAMEGVQSQSGWGTVS